MNHPIYDAIPSYGWRVCHISKQTVLIKYDRACGLLERMQWIHVWIETQIPPWPFEC
jgi:hypothetical protein